MENQNYFNTTLGVAAGLSTKAAIMRTSQKALPIFYHMYMDNLSSKTLDFATPAFDLYEKSGLKNNGVKLFHIDKNNFDEVLKNVFSKNKKKTKSIDEYNPVKRFLIKLRGKKFNSRMRLIADGYNACYIPAHDTILINTKKLGYAAFHEMGHALHYKDSAVRNFINKSKTPIIKYGAPAILAIGLLKNKKGDNEKSKNIFDRTTDFIKNNAGKLTALCYAPILAEEATASVLAVNLAKGYLDKPMFKTMCKYNVFGFMTYLTGAALAGLTTRLGVYVRDKIVSSGIKNV